MAYMGNGSGFVPYREVSRRRASETEGQAETEPVSPTGFSRKIGDDQLVARRSSRRPYSRVRSATPPEGPDLLRHWPGQLNIEPVPGRSNAPALTTRV